MGGMERNFGVGILLSLRDVFSKNAQKIERSMKGLDSATDYHTSRIEQSMARIKKGAIMMGIGAGMMAAVAIPVKLATSWQESTAEISTLVNTNKVNMAALSSDILGVAASMGQIPEIAARAAYNIKSAGISAADLPNVLGLAGKAAVAGVTDINSSALLGTQVMNAYKMEVSELPGIYDKLFMTVKEGVTTFPELASSLGEVLSTAKTAKIPFDQLMASIATMTKVGVKTPEAMTSLKALFMALQAPASEAAKELKKVGGREFELAAQTGNLVKMIELLAPKIERLDQMRQLTPNIRALKGLAALSGSLGILKDTTDLMNDSAGAMEEAYRKMAAAFGFQSRVMLMQVKRFLINAGLPFLSVLGQIAMIVGAVVKKLADFTGEHKVLAGVVGGTIGVLGAFVFLLGAGYMAVGLFGLALTKAAIGMGFYSSQLAFAAFAMKYHIVITGLWAKGLLIAAGTAIKSFVISLGLGISAVWSFTAALLANPITWVVIGIVALGVAVYLLIKNFDKVRSFFQGWGRGVVSAWNRVQDAFMGVYDWVKEYIPEILTIFMPVIGIPLMIIKHWKSISAFFTKLWSNITGGIRSFVNTIKMVFNRIADFFLAPFKKIWLMIQKVIAVLPNWALPKQLESIKASLLTGGMIGVAAIATPVAPAATTQIMAPNYQVPQVMSTTSRILEREVIRERQSSSSAKGDEQHGEMMRKLEDIKKRSILVNSRLFLDGEEITSTVTKRQYQRYRERANR